MSRYAFKGEDGDLLTYRGQVIVHGDRSEMEFLIPNTAVIRITDGELGRPTIRLRDHPDLVSVQWPLRRDDFHNPRTYTTSPR